METIRLIWWRRGELLSGIPIFLCNLAILLRSHITRVELHYLATQPLHN